MNMVETSTAARFSREGRKIVPLNYKLKKGEEILDADESTYTAVVGKKAAAENLKVK